MYQKYKQYILMILLKNVKIKMKKKFKLLAMVIRTAHERKAGLDA